MSWVKLDTARLPKVPLITISAVTLSKQRLNFDERGKDFEGDGKGMPKYQYYGVLYSTVSFPT